MPFRLAKPTLSMTKLRALISPWLAPASASPVEQDENALVRCLRQDPLAGVFGARQGMGVSGLLGRTGKIFGTS